MEENGSQLETDERRRELMDLDDLCLLLILNNLSPLPDLFHVAQTNQRLRGLASGRRLYLVVSAEDDDADDSLLTVSDPSRPLDDTTADDDSPLESYAGAVLQSSLRFQTIADAVASSRPGNTILLKPGTHRADEPIVVSWPLHFIGDGCVAEDTAVIAGRDTDLAFDFSASGKVTNISIKAKQNVCVLHRSSSLQMDRCLLSCRPDRGMEHLASPLVTIAAGSRAQRHPIGGEPSSGGQRRRRFDPAFFLEQARRSVAGPGILLVKESRILGSGQAVRCSGSGSLKGVRVIYQVTDPLFWFYVDSAQQEGRGAGGPATGPGIGMFSATASSSSGDAHHHHHHHHQNHRHLCFLENETTHHIGASGSKAPIRPSLLELEPETPEALHSASKRSRLT